MSIEMTIGGNPVNPRDLAVNAGYGGETGTFSFTDPVSIRAGDTVMVRDSGGTMASGVVTSVTKTWNGSSRTTSGLFESSSSLRKVTAWDLATLRPGLSAEDYAIIEDVITDSIVRGYMQDRRDAIDPA